MNQNKAGESIELIKRLMLKAAAYNPPLLIIFTFLGSLGFLAGLVAFLVPSFQTINFLAYWMILAVLLVIASLRIMQNESGREKATFWAGPVLKILQVMFPPLFVGAFIGNCAFISGTQDAALMAWIVCFWLALYGSAMIAASFFVVKPFKLLGWMFILSSCLMSLSCLLSPIEKITDLHLIMGVCFGGIHLLYAGFLRLLKKK